MKRLVVVDYYSIAWLASARTLAQPDDEWELLLLGISEVWFQRRFENELTTLKGYRLVRATEFIAPATQRVRDFLINFIEQLPHQLLGNTTLAQLLNTPQGTQWWFTEICEKSGWRTPFINQLYQLALTQLIIQQNTYDQVWLDLQRPHFDTALKPFNPFIINSSTAQSISPVQVLAKYLLNASKVALALLYARLLIRWSTIDLTNHQQLFFSLYPYWWSRPFAANATERFFPALSQHNQHWAYLIWLSSPQVWWQHRTEMAHVAARWRMLPLQHFVKWRDLFALFSLARCWRLWYTTHLLRIHLRVQFAGSDLTLMAQHEIVRSLTSPEFSQDCLIASAVENLSQKFPHKQLIFRHEFQPLDNALHLGAGARWQTIGFYHPPFTEKFLAYQFPPNTLASAHLQRNWQIHRPVPNYFLAVAPVMQAHLVEQDYPREQIKLCGPQRQGELISFLSAPMSRLVRRQKLNLSTETKIIFVAAGSIDSENEMLFAALAEACASLGEFQLIIKPHPAKANGDASIQLALQILGDRALLIPAQGNLYDYLAAADVLACIPSTIAFEAMALGVMPIVFEAATVYATNSLVNYQAALFVAHNVEVLREAIQASLAQTTIAQQKQAQWAATLPQVLGDLNTPLSDQLFGALSQINY